jgi:hypothetical protein
LFDAPTITSALPSPVTSPAEPIRDPKRAVLFALPCGNGLSRVRISARVAPLKTHALPWSSLQPFVSAWPHAVPTPV